MDKKRYYITLFTVAFLVLFVLLFVWWQGDNTRIAGRCAITNIELVNVTPSDCWSGDFATDYCPVPKNIDCSFEIAGLADLLLNFAKTI